MLKIHFILGSDWLTQKIIWLVNFLGFNFKISFHSFCDIFWTLCQKMFILDDSEISWHNLELLHWHLTRYVCLLSSIAFQTKMFLLLRLKTTSRHVLSTLRQLLLVYRPSFFLWLSKSLQLPFWLINLSRVMWVKQNRDLIWTS